MSTAEVAAAIRIAVPRLSPRTIETIVDALDDGGWLDVSYDGGRCYGHRGPFQVSSFDGPGTELTRTTFQPGMEFIFNGAGTIIGIQFDDSWVIDAE